MHTSDGAELVVVSDNARAAAIKARRNRLGHSLTLAASESKRLKDSGRLARAFDRGTISEAEKGLPSVTEDTYQRLDALYDALEEEAGEDDGDDIAANGGGLVTVKLSGNFGVSVTVQGPVGDRDEVQAIAMALLREMRAEPPE